MVQEFSPLKTHSSYISDALAPQLGAGLGNFMGSYFANKALEDLRNDPSMKGAPVSERLSRLQSVLSMNGTHGQKMFEGQLLSEKQRIQEIEQKRTEDEQEILGRFGAGETISAKDRKKLSAKSQIELQKLERAKKQASNMKQALINSGVDEANASNFADIYESATEGGKTELLKQYNDMLRRGKQGFYSQNENKSNNRLDENQSSEWEELPEVEGMTPAEEIKNQSENRKQNLPLYDEINKRLSGFEDELRDIGRLQQLDERGNLPSGGEKWAIDWQTGDPRISPSLLGPDGELYLKTIYNMYGKAKEFFPGRVTNFDLETFKKRFPSLANSPSGRKLILKQIELANKIAYLKDDLLRQAYEHYGSGADPIQVRKIVNKKYNEQKKELEGRLKNLDGLLESEYQKNINNQSQQSQKPGMVQLRDPKGIMRWVPEDFANQRKGIQ